MSVLIDEKSGVEGGSRKRKRRSKAEDGSPKISKIDTTLSSEVSKKEKSPKKKKKKRKRNKSHNPEISEESVKENDNQESNPEKEESIVRKKKKFKKPKAPRDEDKVSEKNKKKEEKTVKKDQYLVYLKTWKKSRSEWKFKKNRQTWLLSHAYNEDLISPKHFDILLEYIANIQGRIRDLTLERAVKIIQDHEKWQELSGEKTVEEISKEVGSPEPSQIMLDRANEIKIVLGDESSD